MKISNLFYLIGIAQSCFRWCENGGHTSLGNIFVTWKHFIWKHFTWKHFTKSVGMVKSLGNISFGNISLGNISPNPNLEMYDSYSDGQ